MYLPKDIIIVWSGTNAAIPANWTRETTLDSKYPKATADAVEPNVTGGAANHTHTSPSHTHAVAAHTHTYTTSTHSIEGNSNQSNVNNLLLSGNTAHTGTSGAKTGGTTAGTAVTYGSASNDPPYYEVIFIKSTGANGIPDDAITLFGGVTIPTGWEICDGDASTPDLVDKYLKGAGTGADAGGTGGSLTNTHDISHTHTTNSHTHVAANSNAYSGSKNDGSEGGAWINSYHTHSVTLNGAGTQALNASTDSLVTAETVEPAYKKLLAIQNQNGAPSTPLGIIGMWLGTLATIPAGWSLCDGTVGTPDMRDKFLKMSNGVGDIETTGGSDTHTHAAQAHSHTGSGTHTHTGTVTAAGGTINYSVGNSQGQKSSTTTHTLASVSSDTANYANANTTANSSSNEPQYRTVAYIKLIALMGSGILLG